MGKLLRALYLRLTGRTPTVQMRHTTEDGPESISFSADTFGRVFKRWRQLRAIGFR